MVIAMMSLVLQVAMAANLSMLVPSHLVQSSVVFITLRMPLLDRNKFPPGGFAYREAAIDWAAPHDGLGFTLKAQQIQAARLQNPHAGLDPSIYACEESLDVYTCVRLKNDPKWCVPTDDQVAIAAAMARKAVPCAGCGKRSKRA